MPNNVTNRVMISGSVDEIKSIRETCFVFHPSVHETDREGDLIFKKDNEYGWFNPKTNVFRSRVDHKICIISENGVPDGWVPHMTKEFTAFDFDKIKPMPDDVRKTTESHGLTLEDQQKSNGRNWYDWCCNEWGTKWNSYTNRIDVDTDLYLDFRFDTAWSPPTPVFIELSRKFTNVNIKVQYFDEGHNFWGEAEFCNGEVVSNDCRPVKGTKGLDDLGKKLCIELKGYDPDKNDD